MSGDERIVLRAEVHAPARARDWLAARAAVPAGLLDDALLVTSELVTNAVRHGRPEIVLSLRQLPDGLRIAVRDDGAAVPVRPSGQPEPDRPTGRGLLIVAATAREWGITPHASGPGKTVWADLTTGG